MKTFAEIDKDNIVKRVIIVESAEKANNLFGGIWVETFSDNPNKNRAGKGYTYVPELDNFYAPKPYEDWILDEKLKWKPNSTNENIMIIPEHIKPKIIVTQNDLIYKWDNKLCKWEEI